MESLFDHSYLIYAGIMSGTILVLLILTSLFLSRNEEHRISRLKRSNYVRPVKTTAPDDPVIGGRTRTRTRTFQGSIEVRFSIIRKIAKGILVFIWLIALSLPLLGTVPATFLTLGISAVSVIVGIAARPIIENIIAGTIITFSRTINVGDTIIIDGHYGSIEDINMTHAILKVWDWKRFILPNSVLMQKEITNLSLTEPYLWAHVEFWVAHDADLGVVKELSIETARKALSSEEYEDPRFWILDIKKDAVKCWIAAWASDPADAWRLRSEIRTTLIMRLNEAGIRPHGWNITTSASADFERS